MEQLVLSQRRFYRSGKTQSAAFRIMMLRRLRAALSAHEAQLYQALYADLHKCETEAWLTELQIVYGEIDDAIRHVERWMWPQRVKTPITHFPASSYVYPEPHGNVLILSPWNYPVQLALAPLAGAIAGGNCAVLKASKHAPHTSAVLKAIIDSAFAPEYIACISEEYSYDDVLAQKYGLIFFTGSERVGKIVMEAASRQLCPVVLELGGKSPCIIEKSADVALAAKRVAWGKFLNAGQTCVAPDYVLIDAALQKDFLAALEKQLKAMYGDALTNPDYGHIVSRHHFDRLRAFVDAAPQKIGGAYDENTLCIAPTVLPDATWNDAVMQEEIFGPILPVLAYENLDDVLEALKEKARPLAFYFFSEDKTVTEHALQSVSFGGGCVNDVVMHLANHHLPFGGAGESGMGCYHGRYSFESFTRKKAVLKNRRTFDLPLRYPPYSEKQLRILHRITGKKPE